MAIYIFEKFLGILKKIGLTGKEAKAYLTLLSIDTNSASTIARKAGLNRSACYSLLEKLLQKGFIQQVIKENITCYQAVEPKYLLHDLKQKYLEFEDGIEQMAKLKIHQKQIEKPKIIFYQGKIGVQNIMEDSLKTKDSIRTYASLNELIQFLPHHFPLSYNKRRAEKGISAKAIYPASLQSYIQKKKDRQQLCQSRLIPQEMDFQMDLMIYDNKVGITALKEKFSVLIESREMAEAQKKLFDFVWKGASKYDEIMTKYVENKLIIKKSAIIKK